MDILNQIIEKLSKEEIRNFKLFYGRSGTSEERKDLALFNYIRSSGERFDGRRLLTNCNTTRRIKTITTGLKTA